MMRLMDWSHIAALSSFPLNNCMEIWIRSGTVVAGDADTDPMGGPGGRGVGRRGGIMGGSGFAPDASDDEPEEWDE